MRTTKLLVTLAVVFMPSIAGADPSDWIPITIKDGKLRIPHLLPALTAIQLSIRELIKAPSIADFFAQIIYRSQPQARSP